MVSLIFFNVVNPGGTSVQQRFLRGVVDRTQHSGNASFKLILTRSRQLKDLFGDRKSDTEIKQVLFKELMVYLWKQCHKA
jgi:hypothetical protein